MHWQTEYPDKASWQANLLGGMMLVGLLALGFGVDFKVYNLRSHITGDEPGMRGYVIDRWGLQSLKNRKTPMAFESRDYILTPLTMRERARRARYMSAALPDAPEGWALRSITLEDVMLLRPDWANCGLRKNRVSLETSVAPERSHCPSGISWYDTWVYARGEERIAVWLRYDRDRDQVPFYCMPRVSHTLLTRQNFPQRRAGSGSQTLMQSDGWTFRALPRHERGITGTPDRMPVRAYAEKKGDAMVQIFAMTNGSQTVMSRVLSDIDFDFLDAMIAPPA